MGKGNLRSTVIPKKHRNISASVANMVILPGSSSVSLGQHISLSDRIVRVQANLITFLAENRLPLTFAPKILGLSKSLGKDLPALNATKISDCTAGYKLRDGLAHFWDEQLAGHLRNNPFSLTIDESTSHSNQRVLGILVHYWHDGRVVCQHLRSLELKRVDAEGITNILVDTLNSLNIPCTNIVTIHMDSCNVMRGIKSGVFKRMKEKFPQLIDTGGDTPHTVHNASKKLASAFQCKTENFLDSLSLDLDEIGQRENLRAIGSILGVSIKSQKRRIDNRWLSELPILEQFFDDLPSLTIFYSCFIVNENDYRSVSSLVESIISNCEITSEGKSELTEICSEIRTKYLKKSNSTQAKKMVARRKKITDFLFTNRDESLLIADFEVRQLTILNDYVKCMQFDVPLIHVQLKEMRRLITRFCSFFIRPSKMLSLSIETIQNPRIYLQPENVFDGLSYTQDISKSKLVALGKQALSGLVSTTKYLLEKLPFENSIIRGMSGLDPHNRCRDSTVEKLSILVDNITDLSADSSKAKSEIRMYCCADESTLPDKDKLQIDEYFHELRDTYPNLTLIAKNALTCFNGPKIEGAFTIMNMTSTEYRPSLSVEQLSASLTAHYRAKLYGPLETTLKGNPKVKPIDSDLVTAMTSAYKLRSNRHKALRLLAAASSRLSEAGKKKKSEEEEKRKSLIQSRRQKLRDSIPGLSRKRRILHDLPTIPKLRTGRDDVIDNSASVDLDLSTQSTDNIENEPKKMRLQTDIRSFFKK